MSTFPIHSRTVFSANYPEFAHKLDHSLNSHRLLELGALAELAEWLPRTSIECNPGDQPIGVDEVPVQTLDRIGDTIRNIEGSGSWVGLRNVEQNPAYERLLTELLDEVRPQIESKTGRMLNLQSFIFVTSAGGVTPYHFDPEHNILLQVRGSKVMTLFPAGNPEFAADEMHELYHRGGRPELPWRDDMTPRGEEFTLTPGEAVYVPVMAPHFVRTGPEPSISISITWRSEWSYAEADARAFNSVLRQMGLHPAQPGRWPSRNLAKAYGWRALRKLGAVA